MTQQYVAGELSSLLEALQPPPGEPLGTAVTRLRREVEASGPRALPLLARRALDLADEICLASLERGDAGAFSRSLGATVALREFGVGACLLP